MPSPAKARPAPPAVRQARADEAALVSEVLVEAARWLDSIGQPLWRRDELAPALIAADVAAGSFHIAESGGEAAGVVRFQLDDPEFWPELTATDSCFVHRLAVRRRFAGGGVSSALLSWAAARTRELGRRWLRLDTDAARPRVRAVYERFGFRFHSERQVGPYLVARYELDCGTVDARGGRPAQGLSPA
jgi:GNAT superfamily N-acetyltransferase